MAAFSFRPKLLDMLKSYSRREFTADLVAGITVGIVALPLAMAFAIASGVKPETGIFTAVITGFLDRIGRANVCPHIEAALGRAQGRSPLQRRVAECLLVT
jgi:uncharacterized membrane protein